MRLFDRVSIVVVFAVVGCLSANSAAAATHRTPRPSASASRERERTCTHCLRAGAASVVVDVPLGTPLAGYGSFSRRLLVPDVLGRYPHAFWFKPNGGVRDPIAARALVLSGNGTRVVWIALDLIGVDRAFTAAVAERVTHGDPAPSTVIVSASHTHSGPGAFVDSALMGLIAADRLDATVRGTLVDAAVAAAEKATRHATPARIGATVVRVPALTKGRLAFAPDPEMVVVKVAAADGRPIALLWNYAIHGTMLSPRNLTLSGDVMGVASREIERTLGVPALFVNGAEGDVSPSQHGDAAMTAVGHELAGLAREAWRRIAPRDADAPRVRTASIDLVAPGVSLHDCIGAWIPRAVRLPLASAFPRDATLTAVTVGDVAAVTVPGELQSSLGRRIKDAVGHRRHAAFVAGLSNDYLGYFLARDAYATPAYVTCASVYGPAAGERLVDAASRLLRGLVDGEAHAAWRERDGGQL